MDLWLPENEQWGKSVKMVKGYKDSDMSKFWGCNVQHGDYSEQCGIVYLKVS